MRCICSHKYIENPFLCGTIPIKNFLNADKITHSSDRTEKISWNYVGQNKAQDKERNKEMKWDGTGTPWRKLEGEKPLHPWKFPTPVKKSAKTEGDL